MSSIAALHLFSHLLQFVFGSARWVLYEVVMHELFGHANSTTHCESRDDAAMQVAQVLVESVLQSGASNKVVEIVAGKQVEALSPDKWFANL